jgi:hypothetical protein
LTGIRAIFKSPTRLRFIRGYVHFGLEHKGERSESRQSGTTGVDGAIRVRIIGYVRATEHRHGQSGQGGGQFSVEERRLFLLPSISFPNRARENKSRAMSLLSNSERRPTSDSDTPQTNATVILLNSETTLEIVI